MGNGTGGEIFAKTAKTPPLQAGVGGDIIAIQIRPLPSSMETRKLFNVLQRRGTPRRYVLRGTGE